MSTRRLVPVLILTLSGAPACAGDAADAGPPRDRAAAVECAPDNGGLVLPDGFCAAVVADGLGAPRHMDVSPEGDLYVAVRGGRAGPGAALVLRDTSGDGVADLRATFDDVGGTGIELWRDWVYVGHDDAVVRYRIDPAALAPAGPPEVVISGLPAHGGHSAKPVEITPDGRLFLNVGSSSNSCQVQNREAGSPGKDPCEELDASAGIWAFSADTPGQTFEDGERFATGMRNTVALHLNPLDGELYGAIHGRDQLHQNWGEVYDAEAGAELPAEELVRIREGDDFGWPYCYFDHLQGVKVLAPEYGGDRETVGRCAEKKDPLVAFPGHWAPNDLAFYDGDGFPDRYRGGVFIAFHGSWNRAPLPQEGANVVFVPRAAGELGDPEVFAEGAGNWAASRDHRPTGLAVGPDGSLYISDDAGGRIWRVVHRPGG
jgi:glucose/arabinose dehydrogenase